jgi:hypothetical protein
MDIAMVEAQGQSLGMWTLDISPPRFRNAAPPNHQKCNKNMNIASTTFLTSIVHVLEQKEHITDSKMVKRTAPRGARTHSLKMP